ncbi:protein of unassigned function [Methylobacterium oryzae CBMB20]|uniref:Protein of unassigned function n=1 Tax=Methylobacterium oryzae CBMB20 TaxID=693986 RepID=A0A089NUW7_9HYPH|nr:protein of unassigned function [Methylobacterium oryzae CBMB20]AIQ90578.1 protein of unassigned function [Methylobacterium oryzae CBMB20]AIQ91753.1 protein of unassigned function [Methylobacterium oryzae CBMB20]AIQ92837.1 protein of unassigned function [Methylobacterium oryzae CBMB20]
MAVGAAKAVNPGGHVRQAYGDRVGNDLITGLFVTVSR